MAKDNPSRTDSRNSQRGRALRLLIEARGGWVSAPELANVGGLQFQTRVYELRHKLGLHIENYVECRGGKRFSRYRLVPGPAASAPEASDNWTPLESGSLFGDLSPERYPD